MPCCVEIGVCGFSQIAAELNMRMSAGGAYLQDEMAWLERAGRRDDGRFADGDRRLGGYGKP